MNSNVLILCLLLALALGVKKWVALDSAVKMGSGQKFHISGANRLLPAETDAENKPHNYEEFYDNEYGDPYTGYYYADEDYNWDDVEDDEWEDWDKAHKEVSHRMWELSSLDIVEHYLNSPSHTGNKVIKQV